MIDPTQITKIDILKLKKTSPEIYHCVTLWEEQKLTWEQVCNAIIILLVAQNEHLKEELLKTMKNDSPTLHFLKDPFEIRQSLDTRSDNLEY